ncbi:hypothetical protein J8281_14250 [Aquimarina sp. U1-2]|uniref:hypothetical protein n=1 Tax=Aquimarina sp. U1-2 TaxID=2823141 RepID=UPI001AED0F51|nr:hypothetical protein [Aquimarina sp. U1-2]MBP2833353.1 hypothetical protein [Aquimarina sp. U1-2]
MFRHNPKLTNLREIPNGISAAINYTSCYALATEVALDTIDANMGMICMPKWALKSFKLSYQSLLSE